MNVTEDASAVVALAISAMEDAVEVTAKHTQQLKQAMDDALEVSEEAVLRLSQLVAVTSNGIFYMKHPKNHLTGWLAGWLD